MRWPPKTAPLPFQTLLSRQKTGMSKGGFTLVEISVALGILSFAMVSIIGLLSIGMTQSRMNIERGVEAQIVDWTRSYLRQVYETKGDFSGMNVGPFRFDADGTPVSSTDLSREVFQASLDPVKQGLPGSAEQLWLVRLTINASARNQQPLGKNAFWFKTN